MPGLQQSRSRVLGAIVAAVAVASALAGCGRNAFVAYSPPAELVPALDDNTPIYLGTDLFPEAVASRCHRGDLWNVAEPGPNGSEWRAVTQLVDEPESRSRVVWFATRRFESKQALDAQVAEIGDWLRDPCVGDDDGNAEQSGQAPATVELNSIRGLPSGAIAAHSVADDSDVWTIVIADRTRQLLMITVWRETPEPVAPDTVVEVVKTAWADFESRNS